jgi:hypothetical protein
LTNSFQDGWNHQPVWVGNNNTNWLIFFKMVKTTNQYVNMYIYICMIIYVDGEYVLYHSLCWWFIYIYMNITTIDGSIGDGGSYCFRITLLVNAFHGLNPVYPLSRVAKSGHVGCPRLAMDMARNWFTSIDWQYVAILSIYVYIYILAILIDIFLQNQLTLLFDSMDIKGYFIVSQVFFFRF